jgi:hypothetical protein
MIHFIRITFSDDEQDQSLEDDDIDYDNNNIDTSNEPLISSSHCSSPFPCGDPYESYDMEC